MDKQSTNLQKCEIIQKSISGGIRLARMRTNTV